jgi:hypothetical protein
VDRPRDAAAAGHAARAGVKWKLCDTAEDAAAVDAARCDDDDAHDPDDPEYEEEPPEYDGFVAPRQYAKAMRKERRDAARRTQP